MSEWRLPVLSDNQKEWVLDARASNMDFSEIASHFREMYPDYAPEIPDDVLIPLLKTRLAQMINASAASAKYFIQAKQNGDIPTNFEAIPIAQPHVRLKYLQELWDATPERGVKGYVDHEGEQVPLYRENTRERLAILSEARKETELLGIQNPEKYNNPQAVERLLIESDDNDFLGVVVEPSGGTSDVDS